MACNNVGKNDTLSLNIQSISRITILGIDGIFMIHSLPDIDIIIVFCSTLHCRKNIRLPSQPHQTDVDFINRGFLYLFLFLFYFHVYMLIENSVSILIMWFSPC